MKTIIDGRKTSTSLYTLCALSVWMAGVKNSVANEIEGTNLLTSIDIAFVAVTVCMILFSAIMTCRYALGRYKNVAIVGYRPRWQLFIYDIIGVILGLTTLFGTETSNDYCINNSSFDCNQASSSGFLWFCATKIQSALITIFHTRYPIFTNTG